MATKPAVGGTSYDLESQTEVEGPAATTASGSSGGSSHEMVPMGSPLMSKWRWIGEKELQYLVINRRTPPPPPSASPPSATELGNEPAATAEAAGEALQKGAFVRVVTEASGTQPSLEGGGEGGRQRIAHILLPTAAESPERAQLGNPDHPPLPKERELFVTEPAASGGKKRKVSSFGDDHDSTDVDQDLEKGAVSCEATLSGGASVAAAAAGADIHRRQRDDDDEPLCRVCHMSTASPSKADVIDLGCACKLDLGRAHKGCAETWFQVRGNRQCEICGEIAQNVQLLEPMDDSSTDNPGTTVTVVTVHRPPTACWQNRPIRNFLLVFLVAAFLIPWLFRFAYYQ